MALIPQQELKRLVNMLIRAAWGTGLVDEIQKYDVRQISLIIDSEERYRMVIEELIQKYGDEVEGQIYDAISNELTRREELIFESRAKELRESGDELQHIRDMIRGRSWGEAKKTLLQMTPAGDFLSDWTEKQTIPDDEAEQYFARLYRTIYEAGYMDYDQLVASSPYKSGDDRYIKRLSEIRYHPYEDTQGMGEDNVNAYVENHFMNSMGWKSVPPPTVEIYRGVSRADSDLRIGEYVTTNRTLARTYMRGNYGKIIRETVPTEDLVIMKLTDFDYPEFIYYPKSMEGQDRSQLDNIKQPFTFREFYNQVNNKSAANYGWYKRASSHGSMSLKDIGFPLDETVVFCVKKTGTMVINPLDKLHLRMDVAREHADQENAFVLMAVVSSDKVYTIDNKGDYCYNGLPIECTMAYCAPLAIG